MGALEDARAHLTKAGEFLQAAQLNQAAAQLEDAGVLSRMPGGQRNRTWEAVGLLDLIAELEAGGQ